MRVTLKGYTELNDDFVSVNILVEREKGKYNNFMISATEYKPRELSKDQFITGIWLSKRNIALMMFSSVWECRNSPQHPVINDIPEYDEEGKIIWATRTDNTPINEDTLPDAIPPDQESIETVGFELVELPPPPKSPPSVSTEERLKFLEAAMLEMMGGA